MIVQCVGCKSRLRVAEEKIPVDSGLKMRCPKCKAVFRVWHPGKARQAAGAVVPSSAQRVPVPESGGAKECSLSANAGKMGAAPQTRRAGTAIFGIGETASKTLPGAPGGTSIFGASAPVQQPQTPGALSEDEWNRDGPASVFGGAANRRKSEHGTVLFGGGEDAPKDAVQTVGEGGGEASAGGEPKDFPGRDAHDFFKTVTSWDHPSEDGRESPMEPAASHGGDGTAFAVDGQVTRRVGTAVFGAYVPEPSGEDGSPAHAGDSQPSGDRRPAAAAELEKTGRQDAAPAGASASMDIHAANAGADSSSMASAPPAPGTVEDVAEANGSPACSAAPETPAEDGGNPSEETDDSLLEEPSETSLFGQANDGASAASDASECDSASKVEPTAAKTAEVNPPQCASGGATASVDAADAMVGGAVPSTATQGEDEEEGGNLEDAESPDADVPDRADREALRFRRKSSSMKGALVAAALVLVVSAAVFLAVSNPAFRKLAEGLMGSNMENVLKGLTGESGLVLVKPALPARPTNRKGAKLLAYTCEIRNGGEKAVPSGIIRVDLMENGRVVATTRAAIGLSLAPEALLDVVSERSLGVLLKEGSAVTPPMGAGETKDMTVVFLKAPKNLEGTNLRFGWDDL